MKDKSFFKFIAKSMSFGLIPILAIAIIFTILALIDPGWLILIPSVIVPLLIVIVPLFVMSYAFYKGRGRQRLIVPVALGAILIIGSYWIPPTSYVWNNFFRSKYLNEATVESCAQISQDYKPKCYELAAQKSGNLKICELVDKEASIDCYKGIYHMITDADLCSSIDLKINPSHKGLSFSAAECIGRSKKDKAWQEACHRISQMPEESRNSYIEKTHCPAP